MDQRKDFIDAVLAKDDSMSRLCARFGINRKTGYKWVARFMESSELVDRSRRPKHSPRAMAQALEDEIIAWRRAHPRWGARKPRDAMLRAGPRALPSVSAISLVLTRNSLIVPSKRRVRMAPSTEPLAHADGPNAVWCIDFKGDFAVARGQRCYPLTVTDAYSRYLIACVNMPKIQGCRVQDAMVEIFHTFGLPRAIRSDNGAPFASVHSPFALTELSLWWRKLGIRHERIRPGKPQENDRHERMHRTLKAETASPPHATRRAQQRAFDRFRREYNETRPHEALGGKVPADFYERSQAQLPPDPWRLDFENPDCFESVRIDKHGELYWNGQSVLSAPR